MTAQQQAVGGRVLRRGPPRRPRTSARSPGCSRRSGPTPRARGCVTPREALQHLEALDGEAARVARRLGQQRVPDRVRVEHGSRAALAHHREVHHGLVRGLALALDPAAVCRPPARIWSGAEPPLSTPLRLMARARGSRRITALKLPAVPAPSRAREGRGRSRPVAVASSLKVAMSRNLDVSIRPAAGSASPRFSPSTWHRRCYGGSVGELKPCACLSGRGRRSQ